MFTVHTTSLILSCLSRSTFACAPSPLLKPFCCQHRRVPDCLHAFRSPRWVGPLSQVQPSVRVVEFFLHRIESSRIASQNLSSPLQPRSLETDCENDARSSSLSLQSSIVIPRTLSVSTGTHRPSSFQHTSRTSVHSTTRLACHSTIILLHPVSLHNGEEQLDSRHHPLRARRLAGLCWVCRIQHRPGH